MKALPSIAFNDFSGTAGDVTSRFVKGRTILTVRPFPCKVVSGSQKEHRNALAKISRAFKKLSDEQIAAWADLAEHLKSATVLGSSVSLTPHNAFVRLNRNRQMAGESLLLDPPVRSSSVPVVSYSNVIMTPQMILFVGIKHESTPYKLVVKMSVSQSPGISSGWSKTVILSSEIEDDWGEADVTKLYLKAIGVEPIPGQKVFIEAYWLDTSTGFTGQVFKDSVIVTGESSYQSRMRITMDSLDPEEEQHVSAIDVDYSTNSPVIYYDTVCLGHSNVASSEVILDQELPSDLIGLSYALARGMGEDGSLHPQSYQIQATTFRQKTTLHFMHRGGKYIKPSEVFGTGVFYTT